MEDQIKDSSRVLVSRKDKFHEMFMSSEGLKDSEICVLCIPDLFGDCSDFIGLKEKLSIDFKVISFDFLGHGLSSKALEYSYNDFLNDTLHIISKLDSRNIFIVGMGVGASISCDLISMHNNPFIGCVLLDADKIFDPEFKFKLPDIGEFTNFKDAKNSLDLSKHCSEETIGKIVCQKYKVQENKFRRALDDKLGKCLGQFSGFSFVEKTKNIKTPVLFMGDSVNFDSELIQYEISKNISDLYDPENIDIVSKWIKNIALDPCTVLKCWKNRI